MPTYYPQGAADAVMISLIVLAAIIAAASWIAGLYDLQNPLPDEEDDFYKKTPVRIWTPKSYLRAEYDVDEEAIAKELDQFAAAADLARGTSDNLVDPGYTYSENLRHAIERTDAVMKGMK